MARGALLPPSPRWACTRPAAARGQTWQCSRAPRRRPAPAHPPLSATPAGGGDWGAARVAQAPACWPGHVWRARVQRKPGEWRKGRRMVDFAPAANVGASCTATTTPTRPGSRAPLPAAAHRVEDLGEVDAWPRGELLELLAAQRRLERLHRIGGRRHRLHPHPRPSPRPLPAADAAAAAASCAPADGLLGCVGGCAAGSGERHEGPAARSSGAGAAAGNCRTVASLRSCRRSAPSQRALAASAHTMRPPHHVQWAGDRPCVLSTAHRGRPAEG